MTKKEYLKQYQTAVKEIDRLTDEIAKLNAMATKVTSSLSGMVVQSSHENSRENAIISLMDKRKSLAESVENWYNLAEKIELAIKSIQNERESFVLECKYINDFTFEGIAEILGCSTRWVHKLHGWALQKINIPEI